MTSTHTPRRRSLTATAAQLVLAAVLASACGGSSNTVAGNQLTGTPETSNGPVPDVLVGEWRADSFITVGALRPVPDDLVATIRFPGAPAIEVETGCSDGSATVIFDSDSTLVLSGLTLPPNGACDERAAGVERDLLGLLGHPLSWGVSDGQLTLLPTDSTDSGVILRHTAPGKFGSTESVAVLVAVAANHRIRVANGSGTPNLLSSVAILDTFGVADSDGLLDPTPGPVSVPDDVRRAIEVELGPISVTWVTSAGDVDTEPNATWDEQPPTALLTLTEPIIDGASGTVISDLRCGPGCVIGGGQAFARGVDGSWTVARQTGAQWHS